MVKFLALTIPERETGGSSSARMIGGLEELVLLREHVWRSAKGCSSLGRGASRTDGPGTQEYDRNSKGRRSSESECGNLAQRFGRSNQSSGWRASTRARQRDRKGGDVAVRPRRGGRQRRLVLGRRWLDGHTRRRSRDSHDVLDSPRRDTHLDDRRVRPRSRRALQQALGSPREVSRPAGEPPRGGGSSGSPSALRPREIALEVNGASPVRGCASPVACRRCA